MQGIADVSGHLTPATVALELKKLERRVPILLHHLKPTCLKAVQEEVRRLQNPDLDFLEQGRIYHF